MNYLGAERARYQLKIQNILIEYVLVEECHSASRRRAMGSLPLKGVPRGLFSVGRGVIHCAS